MCEQMFCLFPGFHPRCLAPRAQPARTQSMETCHYDQYDQYDHNEGFQKIFLKLIISGQGHILHRIPTRSSPADAVTSSQVQRGQELKIAAQIAAELSLWTI